MRDNRPAKYAESVFDRLELEALVVELLERDHESEQNEQFEERIPVVGCNLVSRGKAQS